MTIPIETARTPANGATDHANAAEHRAELPADIATAIAGKDGSTSSTLLAVYRTQLAVRRTGLADLRSHLANERTHLAHCARRLR